MAVQVENEYGSFDKVKAYMTWALNAVKHAGFGDVYPYTADGDVQLPNGTLAELPAAGIGTGFAMSAPPNTKLRQMMVSGAALGGLSLALSARSMHHRASYLAEQKSNSEGAQRKRADVETSISPIIPIGKNSGAGVSMSVRF